MIRKLLHVVGLVGILFATPGMLPGIIPDLGGFVSSLCPQPGSAQLNPCDSSTGIDLSNGNLTATANRTVVSKVVRSVTSHTGGKYYYEWSPHLIPFPGYALFAGVGNSLVPLDGAALGDDANGLGIESINGDYYKNGVQTSIIPPLGPGDIVGIAVDLNAGLFWARANADPWNANGSADPATGIGGFAFPSGITSGAVYAALSIYLEFTYSTVNFGSSAFTQTIPSGYSPWG